MPTLEERDFLVRGLHDEVKQQVFALTMQIGTLKVLIKRDSDVALKRLEDIEHLLCLMQQDLTLISSALSPTTCENA